MKKGGALINAFICIGTHNQPFLQNHLMDVYETHSHAPVYRLFGKLLSGADPGRGNLPKIGQWGVPSPKDFFRFEATATNWIYGSEIYYMPEEF